MTIKTKQTFETETEIAVPLFLQEGKNVIAILDENTVVSIIRIKGYTSIINCDRWIKENEIVNAWSGWNVITREEFYEAYHDAIESILPQQILGL